MTEVSGTYTNGNYGFAVTIPSGTRAFMGTPPSPNHGILIILGEHRTIEVYAAFDAALYGSSGSFMRALLSDGPHGPVARTTVMLAGKPALRARTRTGTVQEDLVAQWVDHAPDDAITMQAILRTTNQADETTFDTVLASIRYIGRTN